MDLLPAPWHEEHYNIIALYAVHTREPSRFGTILLPMTNRSVRVPLRTAPKTYAVHTREPSWFSTSRYDTTANANHSVPLCTATKMDHLFRAVPCRADARVDELCSLQTTNLSTGNHVTVDHTQRNYQVSAILVLQCELAWTRIQDSEYTGVTGPELPPEILSEGENTPRIFPPPRS